MNKNTPTVSARNAYAALGAAGFPKSFVTRLLPDWWDNALLKTSSGAVEFASILKQRLGLEVRFADNGELQVLASSRPARYKKRATTAEGELHVCASLGMALGKLALFCMDQPSSTLPDDPLMLAERVRLQSGGRAVTFSGLLNFCWTHGIPVLFLKELPRDSKRITGMALQIEGRPVIVLGYQSSQNAKQLFVLAHEVAHICLGHVANTGVLIDEGIDAITEAIERETGQPADSEEKHADEFALALLRNGHTHLPLSDRGTISAAELTNLAVGLGNERGVDPGHVILSYAREHDDWMLANQALAYFPDQASARALIKDCFIANCDVSKLTDENRAFLLSMQGFQ